MVAWYKNFLKKKFKSAFGGMFLCILFLCGCSLFETEKVPLEGKRVPVNVEDVAQSVLEPPNVEEKNISLSPVLEKKLLWLQDGCTASRNSGNLFLSQGFMVPAWSYRTNQESSYLTATPIVTQNHVLLYHCGRVHCLDLSGNLQWRQEISEESDIMQFGGGMCSDGCGNIFVATPCCHIFCLSEKDGTILWTQNTVAPVRGAPVQYENYVCCLNMNNQVEVFDTKTGEPILDYSGLVEESRFLGNVSPSISHDGVMVATFSSGEIVALSLTNESLLWIKNDGKKTKSLASTQHHLSHTRCSPLIHENVVYTVTTDHYMYSCDLQTGEVLWKCPLRLNSTPWLSGKMLFCIEKPSDMGHSEWRMVALHADTGKVLWSKNLKNKSLFPSRSWCGPVIANNMLYVANNDGNIIAMDPKKGNILFEYKGGQTADNSVISIAQGKVFIFNSEGVLNVWTTNHEKSLPKISP